MTKSTGASSTTQLIFVLLVIIILRYKEKSYTSELYEKHQYPNEEFYGKDVYSEIDYEFSEYESEVGNMMIDRAFEVARYTGTEQEAETEMGDVGSLSRYYYFNSKNTYTQESDFKFITCQITENEGHVWVETTVLRHDKNGENDGGGCRGALSLWRIENRDNEWYVVRASDGP